MALDPRDERFLDAAVLTGALDAATARKLLETRRAQPFSQETIEAFLVRTGALAPEEVQRVFARARTAQLATQPEVRVPTPSELESGEPVNPFLPWARGTDLLLDTPVPSQKPPEPRARPRSRARDLPERVGEYEVLSEIARGGMGVVYRARRTGETREVALKVLLEGRASPTLVKRFEREIRTGLDLDHPGIVKVQDGGTAGEQLFFTMELIEGRSLDALMETFSLGETVSVLEKVARAVQHAHEKGYVHRDLKPQNVLVAKGGQVKVADFGLAKLLERESSLTKTGALVGTPYYMSPEQAKGDHAAIGPATDVYSIGAMLYEAITGTLPFVSETAMGLLQKILREPPPDPRTIVPNCSPELVAIALRALEKTPASRYPSARALADDLAAWLAGRKVELPRGRSGGLRGWARSRALWVVVPLVTLVVAPSITVVAIATQQAEIAATRKLEIEDALRALDDAAKLADATLSGWTKLPRAEARKALSDARERLERAQHAILDLRAFFRDDDLSILERSAAAQTRIFSLSDALLVLAVEDAGDAELPALEARLATTLAKLARIRATPDAPFGSDELRLALARVEERMGNPERAAAVLEEGLVREPGAIFLERLGELRLELDDARGAREALEAALALEPERRSARLLLARAERLAGDSGKALELALALEKENPRETEARLLALEALLPGDPGRAIDSLRSLERELAKDPEVARRIALALLEAERPEEALLAFTRAAELAPKDPRPLLGRAEARLLLADLPGATADLALAGDLALPGTASRARARAREVRVRALSQDARAAALAKTALAERPQDLGLRFASSCLAGAEADQGELEKIAQALGRRSLAASAWAALARLRAEKGMRESALAAAKKAVELAPTAESLAAEALALGAGVDAGAESPQTVRRARALAHAAFERDRGEGARIFRASRTAARLFQRHGRPRDRERASTLLDLAERAAPWAAAPLLERGRRLEATREGALSDVTDALLPGLKLASGDPEAEVALAAVLLEQNEARHAATAVEWTEHVLEKQLKHARALALHGRAQLALGRAARALADLDASLAIDRSRAETWALKARALTMLGKADLAADAQREATERGPRRDELASSEEDKGIDLAYSKERDFTSAVAHFRRAIDLDPGRGRSWFELGVALLGGGTLPEEGGPIELLARGNYLEFQDGLARSGFVKLLANGIDLEAYAKEYESRAARAGASRSDDLWTAAILRSMIVEAGDESRGAIAQARLALERAISQDPSNVSALAYRGLCRALEGQSDLARHDLERFDLYCPKYGPALFTLALGEARDGKTSEAKAHLERAFSLDKDLRLRLVHYPELRALK